MEIAVAETPIELGTRKLQLGSGAHVLNVPIMAVRFLKLEAGDVMSWSLAGEVLLIRRIEKKTPYTQPESLDILPITE